MSDPSKNEIKIILFLCSWGPHAAYQALQDKGARLPGQIKMVRIPCSGRISKALLIKAFEMGADGVVLAGCTSGSCRYGAGTETAHNNVADTRKILDLIGIGKNRLRMANFMGEESDRLFSFLNEFVSDIKAMGKTPVIRTPHEPLKENRHEEIKKLAAKHDVYACQDCGKCTSACSLTLSGKPFSPRAMANSLILGNCDDDAVKQGVWSCLTCGLCYDRCPSAVNFPEFIKDVRRVLGTAGDRGFEAHGGFFGSLSRILASPDLKVRHWDWLPEDVKTDQTSKVLFFGGCAPYFDIFFSGNFKAGAGKTLVDSIRLLNFFDIEPALIEDERCCGHDLLWCGDSENFLKLARLNQAAINALGVEEVVVACPEGFHTLANEYEAHGIKIDCKITHILDFLERHIDKGAVGFKKLDKALTFQDPCRLSRMNDMSEIPRKILSRLNINEFTEMADSGKSAICCGNCGWTGCDAYSKALQRKRLDQARATRADILVTACPKCKIHLSCASDDPFILEKDKMEITDLVSVLADTIVWE